MNRSFAPRPVVWPALGADAVHLWCCRLDPATSRVQALHELLDDSERARADRFVFPEGTRHFTVARGFLREVLSVYTGIAAAELRFHYGDKGKPSLADGPHFNLSHSGELALLGVCADRALGVDVERVRPVENHIAIAQRFFAPEENTALAALPENQQNRAFQRGWTRKEAYIKAVGSGLSLPLESFAVSLDKDDAAQFIHLNGDTHRAQGWSLYSLQPTVDYLGAVAVTGSGWQLAGWWWWE